MFHSSEIFKDLINFGLSFNVELAKGSGIIAMSIFPSEISCVNSSIFSIYLILISLPIVRLFLINICSNIYFCEGSSIYVFIVFPLKDFISFISIDLLIIKEREPEVFILIALKFPSVLLYISEATIVGTAAMSI